MSGFVSMQCIHEHEQELSSSNMCIFFLYLYYNTAPLVSHSARLHVYVAVTHNDPPTCVDDGFEGKETSKETTTHGLYHTRAAPHNTHMLHNNPLLGAVGHAHKVLCAAVNAHHGLTQVARHLCDDLGVLVVGHCLCGGWGRCWCPWCCGAGVLEWLSVTNMHMHCAHTFMPTSTSKHSIPAQWRVHAWMGRRS